MIAFSEALELIDVLSGRRRACRAVLEVPLSRICGKILAQDVFAIDAHPRFDNSAMDGFAVASKATVSASQECPVELRVVGCRGAGAVSGVEAFSPGDCLQIMTGARMPAGCFDAVVRLEDVDGRPKSSVLPETVRISRPIIAGSNVRYRGEDLTEGALLARAGTRLGPEHVLAFSSVGVSRVSVYAPLRVSLLSTGCELEAHDCSTLGDSSIRNSNAPFLCALFEALGHEVVYQGGVQDSQAQLERVLGEMREQSPDIIITTGGVSVGRFDYLEPVLRNMGAAFHFHGVSIRPGKPILCAEFSPQGPLIFGLPGNPIAVAAGYRFFISRYIRGLFGQGVEAAEICRLGAAHSKVSQLTFFQRARRVREIVEILPGQASFMAGNMSAAQGWVVLPAATARVEAGTEVEWYSLW